MEQNENYLNYADTKPIIDKYGQVQLTRKDNGGNIEYLTPEQLNNRSKAQYNYFNSDAELTRMEAGLGEEMIQTLKAATVGKVGSIQDIQDKAVKAGFDKAVDDYINSLGAPTNISSVLTNDIGGAYMNNFTYSIDEANADPNKILLKVPKGREGNPEPDFASTENGKKQEIAAKQWLKRQLIEKLDRKIGVDQTSAVGYAPQQQEWQMLYNRGKGEEKIYTKNVVTNLSKLWGGTPEEVQAALPYFKSKDPTIQKLTRENGVLLVTKNVVDSKGKFTGKTTIDRYPFKVKGVPLEYEDWIQGASLGLAGIPDVNEALDNTIDGYRTFRNHNNPKNKEIELIFSTADAVKENNKGGTGATGSGKGSTKRAGIN
jgi:hypothetical protein